MRFIDHPTYCHYRGKKNEVYEIVVGLVPKDFANDSNEKDQTNQEVFGLHKNVHLF
jgi:hypothetical protein